MTDFGYDYLSGKVTISEFAPANWVEKKNLDQFYTDPNNLRWGRKLSRVLFHESLHYWQFLCSKYVADLVSEEWQRVLHFEKNFEILPQSDKLKHFAKRSNSLPFSSRELLECWARFWDVHTRGPNVIIEDENICVDPSIEISRVINGEVVYSDKAFHEVILKGEDSILYAAPYRWLLEKSNSFFCDVTFPLLVFFAFTTDDPPNFFFRMCNNAINSSAVKRHLFLVSNRIEEAWIEIAPTLGEIFNKTREELGLEKPPPGFQIIMDKLSNHPIFKYTHKKYEVMKSHLDNLKNIFYDVAEFTHYKDQATQKPLFYPFCLPGSRYYRELLGMFFSPPRIVFENLVYDSPKPSSDETFVKESDELEQRIKQFKFAEKAQSVGLPLDAFK